MSVRALTDATPTILPAASSASQSTVASSSLQPSAYAPTGSEKSLVGRVTIAPRDLQKLRETCREQTVIRKAKNLKEPFLIKLAAKRAAELAYVDGRFGIKLDEEVIHTYGRTKTMDPVTVDDYWDAIYDQRDNPEVDNLMTKLQSDKPPIKITMREAFEYVIQKVENYSRMRQPLFLRNDVLMTELTNIKFEDEKATENFPSTWGYVSWFTVICETLKKTGRVQNYYMDSDMRIIPF